MDLGSRMKHVKSLLTYLLLWLLFMGAFILATSCSLHSEELYKDSELESAQVDGMSYDILLKDGILYCSNGKRIERKLDYGIFDMKVYDIDRDCNDEIAVIDSARENLIMFEIQPTDEGLFLKEIYRKDFSEIDPWMVEAGDVDGDGIVEIFLGVNKRTEFYEDVRNRPFYYSWDGMRLEKKWTGSYFSDKELVDVKFADLFESGRDETIALERDSQGRYLVSIYGWLGFGFVKTAESCEHDEVDDFFVCERDNGTRYIEIEYMRGNQTIREEVKFFE